MKKSTNERDNHPIVKITWVDTTVHLDTVWVHVKELTDKKLTIEELETVGYLIDENKTELRVTNCMGADGMCIGLTMIPVGYVKRVEVITAKGWKTRRRKKK
jgi:hypothetical protein